MPTKGAELESSGTPRTHMELPATVTEPPNLAEPHPFLLLKLNCQFLPGSNHDTGEQKRFKER